MKIVTVDAPTKVTLCADVPKGRGACFDADGVFLGTIPWPSGERRPRTAEVRLSKDDFWPFLKAGVEQQRRSAKGEEAATGAA